MFSKFALGVIALSAVAAVISAPAKAVDFPKKNIRIISFMLSLNHYYTLLKLLM